MNKVNKVNIADIIGQAWSSGGNKIYSVSDDEYINLISKERENIINKKLNLGASNRSQNDWEITKQGVQEPGGLLPRTPAINISNTVV